MVVDLPGCLCHGNRLLQPCLFEHLVGVSQVLVVTLFCLGSENVLMVGRCEHHSHGSWESHHDFDESMLSHIHPIPCTCALWALALNRQFSLYLVSALRAWPSHDSTSNSWHCHEPTRKICTKRHTHDSTIVVFTDCFCYNDVELALMIACSFMYILGNTCWQYRFKIWFCFAWVAFSCAAKLFLLKTGGIVLAIFTCNQVLWL